MIPRYGWEYVQQALFQILLDDNKSREEWNACSYIIWGAVLDKQKIKKKTTVGLLNYRLGDIDSPYENETVWSITSNLFHLDYCNSEYNALKDERIIAKLRELGIKL